ncbi:MAG TPA: hypothetical protein VL547_10200, partial [Dinghuibacter sp.]|uniref:glycoside hydrolase family 38 N-terminal domain-containing protein n=1 Tax=Dinghuibacter sp. TaxID=2024697 RepID=UPI002BA340B2
TIGYGSYTPMATQALLTRVNTGQDTITWETEAVPKNYNGDTVYFTWVGGNAAGTAQGDEPYDLYVNDKETLTITTHKNYAEPGWFYRNDNGVSIRFEKRALDHNNDVTGRVTLAIPLKMLTKGKPVRLAIAGRKMNSQDWLMVYQYHISDQFEAEVLPLLKRAPNGDTLRMVRIYGAYKKPNGTLTINGEPHGVHNDYNELQYCFKYQARDKILRLQMALDGQPLPTDTFKLDRLVPLEVHLVSHSHTDIGYSNLQQEVARIQNDNLKKAIALIQKTKDYPEAARFRWNVESLWAVENFLDSADATETQAFADALHTGRLTLQAFYANELTGLMDAEELDHLTSYARTLEKRFNIKINSAMITDVPGYSWSFVQGMQRAGIKYFSAGPNPSDRIGGVLKSWADKPFYWKVPGSDEKVLTDIAGSSYAWFHGSAGAREPVRLTQRLLAYVNRLNDEKYPYRYALVRYNIISDNAPLDTGISDFVKNWNEQYLYPKLVLSTPAMVLGKIEQACKLPVYSGDMSPYWEDGAASTAAELGWNRRVRAALERDEAAGATKTDRAWRGVVMFDEHTWGAWSSITDPDNPFTTAQWQFKRDFLTEADSLEKTIRPQGAQIYNPHSWPIHTTVRVPDNANIVAPDGSPLLQQALSTGERLVYLPNIPAYTGITLQHGESSHMDNTERPINVTIDPSTGALITLTWRGRNLIRPGFNQYLYVPGRDPAGAQTAKVKRIDTTENGPLLTVIRIDADAPGARKLTIEYRLDNVSGALTIVDSIDKEKVRTKEAVHFAFPFDIPGADLVADNGAFPYHPFSDTLPGGNRDFGYVGKWMDVSNAKEGVTLCPLETPIMEWGSMRSEVIPAGASVSPWKKTFQPIQTFYSYAMNNYWHTNYKADQEGWAVFTYVLTPHGPRNLADCYKLGEEAAMPPTAGPATGPGIRLTNPNIVVAAIRGRRIEVYNPTDKPQATTIRGNQPITLKPFERRDYLID